MFRFIILLLLLVFSVGIYSQNPGKYKLQKISLEKGLSQSVVTGITQDSLGFMWFSTLDGVNRFDGYHFENFYNQKNNPYSLPNNFVNAILCDNDNEIWIGTLDGLCKFDYKTERFTVFRNIPEDSTSLSNNEITCLALSADGNIWIGTNNGGLNLYNKKLDKFIRFEHKPGNTNTIASNNIYSIFEDKNKLLWIGTSDAGLNCLNHKSGEIKHIVFFNNPNFSQSYLQIKCIYQDIYGNNWIGTENGLIHHTLKTNQFKVFNNDPHSACSLNGRRVNAIVCDWENNLWVGTEENGLNIISLADAYSSEKPICFTQIGMQENEYGLSIRTVLSLFTDQDKNIWIGTYSGGINFVSSIPLKFQKYTHNPYDPNTIGYPKIWGLCEDKNGNIWVGTDGAGLDKLNPNTNKITHYRHDKNNPSSISDNAILCAIKDHKNNLWFGTYQGGLNRYNEKTNAFKSYKNQPGNPNSLPLNDVRVIYEDPFYNIWIGTNSGGLAKYNPENDNFQVFNPHNSSLTIGNIRAIISDSSGNLYIGTYSRGLDIFNTKTGKTRNFQHQRNQSNSISDNYVYSLAFTPDGNIWVGTGNGLNLFNTKTETFEVFNEQHGLSNNFIHAILTDKNGNLWVSTNKGISLFLVKEKKFENFDAYDGLQGGEFLDGSALYASNGLMWFGGTNGLNSFNPENVSKNTFKPKVVLTGLQLFNTPVKASTAENPNSPLAQSVSIAKKILLNYKQSVFTIDYVGINYSFPEKTRYAYRIKEVDEGWVEAGNRRSATYRDLPDGKYIFEVKASNQDGLWFEEHTSIEIIIKPPFWKTWWAYLIYISLIVSIIYLIYNYYKKQNILKNNLLLEQLSHQKDQELNQERFRFFTNISHEFRTPLTLILGPVEELIEKEDPNSTLGKKLSLIFRNAKKLLELINLLLDFRKVETGKMELRVSKYDIVKFSNDIIQVYKDLANKKNISLSCNTTNNEIEAWFDREKFEIIYNNLLSNAFKFTPNNRSITLSITERKAKLINKNSDVIEISFSDTGTGIAEKHINHIFDSYYSIEHSEGIKGTGIGLALTKSLVEMHKGKITVTSTQNKGSNFIIELQKGNKHFDEGQLIDINNSLGNNTNPISIPSNLDINTNIETAFPDPENIQDKKVMLVVEDNNDVREYIVGNFTEGFVVLQANSGIDGLKLASKHIPDIIISDIMMPEMDGIEFCRKVKEAITTSHIPVILLTARSSITHKREGYETGADSYVTKPFSIDLLASRVENLIKSRNQLKNYYTRSMVLQPSPLNVETPDDRFIRQMVEIIEKHITEPDFDISIFVNELNMSRPVIYRKIKALTGYSIIEFTKTVKLNKAAQYLKTGQYRVSETAYLVGFSDPKYFTKCFKEQFNISPSDLIRNHDITSEEN